MKIGLIFGCFDLFHIGHLNLLKSAKQYCDYLIVGINSNDTIFSYKNHYPIIDEKERLEIVSSIKYVDEVYLINKEERNDRIPFCKQHNVNIIFAGDDWKDSTIYKKIQNEGIEVHFFPYTKGISTTQLREKIKL